MSSIFDWQILWRTMISKLKSEPTQTETNKDIIILPRIKNVNIDMRVSSSELQAASKRHFSLAKTFTLCEVFNSPINS